MARTQNPSPLLIYPAPADQARQMVERQAGLSSFVLASPFGDDDLGTFSTVREMGYDLVEVCVEDLSVLTPSRVRDAADRAGLALSVGGAFGPTRDVSHATKDGRARGLDYLCGCIDFAAAIGATIVSGPMYSAVGKARAMSAPARARQRQWAVDALRIAADFAQDRGVSLAIEALNRFETDLVNTVEQGIDLCASIDRPNVGLALDTFHLNIEEKDIGAAIRAAAPLIRNVQVSENDRGACGSGHVPWSTIFDTLDDIGYAGPLVVESFRDDVVEIARAVSLWRPVANSMDDLARDSLAFLRRSGALGDRP